MAYALYNGSGSRYNSQNILGQLANKNNGGVNGVLGSNKQLQEAVQEQKKKQQVKEILEQVAQDRSNGGISHNPIKGTWESVQTGAEEGIRQAVNNAGAFIKTDLTKMKYGGIERARLAAQNNVDYDSFVDKMVDKYGFKFHFIGQYLMNDDEKKMFFSASSAKDLGIENIGDWQKVNREYKRKLRSIELERGLKQEESRRRLQAVDDRYQLGVIGEFAQDLGSAAGNMAPSLGLGLINPALGVAAFGTQAAAQGYGEALDEGATHEQATRYGVTTGLKEAAIERLTGGLSKFYGKGILDDVLKVKPNNSLRNVILNTAKGAVGEGAEEALSGAIDPYLQRATYNPEAENASLGELSYQAAIGAALGAILGGGGNVVDYGGGRGTKYSSSTQDSSLIKNKEDKILQFTDAAEAPQRDVRNETVNNLPSMANIAQDGTYVKGDMLNNGRSAGVGSFEKRYSYAGTNADGVEVYETSAKTKALPYNERKKEFLRLMKEEYRGRTARFTVDGQTYYAKFDDADINKNIYGDNQSTRSGYKAKITAGADGDIFDLLEDAAYKESAKESGKKIKAHLGVQDWDYFVKTVQVDNKMYDVLINVRKSKDNQYVYNIALRENKKIKVSPPVAKSNTNGLAYEGVPNTFNNSISNRPENVNGNIDDNRKNFANKQVTKEFKNFVERAAGGKAGLKKVFVSLPEEVNAFTQNGVIYINSNFGGDLLGAKRVLAHEIFHNFENSAEGQEIYRLALESAGISERELLQAKKNAYADVVELDDAGARAEVAAEFVEKAMVDEATINRILTTQPNLAQRIWRAVKDLVEYYRLKKRLSPAERSEYVRLIKAQKLYEQGFRKLQSGEYQANQSQNMRFSIAKTNNGDNVVVIEEDIFKNLSPNTTLHKHIHDYIVKNIGDMYNLLESGDVIYVGKDLPDEYTQSEYTKKLAKKKRYDLLNAKNQAIQNVGELIEIANHGRGESNKKAKHNKDAKYGWYRYDTKFALPNGGIYDAVLLIRHDGDGKKYLYDLIDIKKDRTAILASTKNGQAMWGKNTPASPINNSIS